MNDSHDPGREDLFWHALNYRGAATQHAEEMWQELLACVERKVAAERERCATVLQMLGYDDSAAIVRAQGTPQRGEANA